MKPGVLRDERRYLVTISTSVVNPRTPSTDMDLAVYVSDGVRSVGHFILDQSNYASGPPIWCCETASGQTRSETCHQTGVRVSSLPAQVVTGCYNVGGNQPAAGIAHAAYHHEIAVFHAYTSIIRPSRGLYLEVYRDHVAEQYSIKFFKVRVDEEITS